MEQARERLSFLPAAALTPRCYSFLFRDKNTCGYSNRVAEDQKEKLQTPAPE